MDMGVFDWEGTGLFGPLFAHYPGDDSASTRFRGGLRFLFVMGCFLWDRVGRYSSPFCCFLESIHLFGLHWDGLVGVFVQHSDLLASGYGVFLLSLDNFLFLSSHFLLLYHYVWGGLGATPWGYLGV